MITRAEQRSILLGGLLAKPGALEECLPLIAPQALDPDQRRVLRALAGTRRHPSGTEARLGEVIAWLTARRISPLVLQGPLEAFDRADQMLRADIVALAREVGGTGS